MMFLKLIIVPRVYPTLQVSRKISLKQCYLYRREACIYLYLHEVVSFYLKHVLITFNYTKLIHEFRTYKPIASILNRLIVCLNIQQIYPNNFCKFNGKSVESFLEIMETKY